MTEHLVYAGQAILAEIVLRTVRGLGIVSRTFRMLNEDVLQDPSARWSALDSKEGDPPA